MYKLIEYSDNYWKTSEILWQYCSYELTVDGDGGIQIHTKIIHWKFHILNRKNSRVIHL